MKYQDTTPIRTKPVQLWVAKTEKGNLSIHAFSLDCSIEHIHNYLKVHLPPNTKFKMHHVDCGSFEVSGEYDTYSSDGRKITQDWKVTL